MISLADDAPNRSSYCECGRWKNSHASGCERCAYLDGRFRVQSLIISYLRGTDGMTVTELCAAVYGVLSDSNKIKILRTLQTLMKRKRVRRYELERDKYESLRDCADNSRRFSHAAGRPAWVYQLDGYTERSIPK